MVIFMVLKFFSKQVKILSLNNLSTYADKKKFHKCVKM